MNHETGTKLDPIETLASDTRLSSLADIVRVTRTVINNFPRTDERRKSLIGGVWEHVLENNLPLLIQEIREGSLKDSKLDPHLVGCINGIVQILRPEFIAALNENGGGRGVYVVEGAQAFLTEIAEHLEGVK